jgi:1-deoxy-D-xylulose-5-phosphate synthase
MRTIRMGGGVSGFTKRSESEYDPFGAGTARPPFRPRWLCHRQQAVGPAGKAIAVIATAR